MNDKAKLIYQFYKNKGLSDNQIFGILGNVQAESTFNPGAINSSSGAYGIFQWLGSRKNELFRFASQKGKSKDDLWTQLEFSWHELTGTEKGTLSAMNENKNASVETMAELWENKYERSGGALMAERKEYANNWAKYFTSQSVSSNDTTYYKPPTISGNTTSGNTTSGNSTGTGEIDLSLTGTIIKVLTVLLICVCTIVFLVLALKNTAIGGVKDIAKDVLSDALSDNGKGGKKE